MIKVKILGLLFFCLTMSCGEKTTNKALSDSTENTNNSEIFFDLSLAQWSLNKAIRSGEMDALDFAEEAKKLGFEGIEYVSFLYKDKLEEYAKVGKGLEDLLAELKQKSEEFDVTNLLIMVDGEGDLAANSEDERRQAVENHKKWVDAAAFLGCHSIRVNLSGSSNKQEWINNSVKGLTKLAEYAATKNINVIVENHGGLSSNAAALMNVMEQVNMNNCGTLPDFGNFCIRRSENTQSGRTCLEEYDYIKGIEEMMPKAKAVSAKSYNFDEQGQETKLDYLRLIEIVKEAGYTGFIGVEYEGSGVSEKEGILKTKELLIQSAKQIN